MSFFQRVIAVRNEIWNATLMAILCAFVTLLTAFTAIQLRRWGGILQTPVVVRILFRVPIWLLFCLCCFTIAVLVMRPIAAGRELGAITRGLRYVTYVLVPLYVYMLVCSIYAIAVSFTDCCRF